MSSVSAMPSEGFSALQKLGQGICGPARPNSVNWIFYLEMNDLIVYTVQELSVSNGLQFQVCEIPEWPFHETSLNQLKIIGTLLILRLQIYKLYKSSVYYVLKYFWV